MLSAALGPGGWFYSTKLSVALPKYRELLRARSKAGGGNGGADESSSLFQQARQRVLARAAARRAAAARVDPRRAFARLSERWAAARLSLHDLRLEQRQRLQARRDRLRRYVAEAVGAAPAPAAAETGSFAASGSSSAASPAAAARAAQATAAPADRRALPAVAAVAAEGGQLDPAAAAAALGSDGLLRHLVLAVVGGACKLFLAAGARTSVSGGEHVAAALARPPGRGLVTVSNHVGAIDDPLVTAALVPAAKLLDPPAVRWTLCATDRCFKSAALAPFFRAAKVLPVERGAGLAQFGMRVAQSRLAAGEWVHVFPEGTRSRDGRMLPVRKGVGWLVAAAAAGGGEPPLVLPFVHSGMQDVLPRGAALPRLGRELRVLVGEPVPVADLLAVAAAQGWPEQRLEVAIADRVGQAMYRLKAQLDGLPLEAVAPQRADAALSAAEDTLLPLIEDEMDSLAHRWRDGPAAQRAALPSLTQRLRAAAAAARRGAASAGAGWGAGRTFEEVAAATEEAAGLVSSWEHAGGVPAPWATAVPCSEPHAGRGDAPAMLSRMLRLLRGGATPSPLAGDSGSSAAGILQPMDAVAACVAAAGGGGTGLAALLAAAADYSAERARHMRLLLLQRGAPPAAAASACECA